MHRFTLIALLSALCLAQGPDLNRYVGAYEFSNAYMVVTLEDGQLLSRLGAQQAIAITAKSATVFTPKGVNAELEFAKDDSQGRPTELILHQGGRDQTAKRLPDASGKLAIEAAAAFPQRLKDQKAAPGTDVALRKMVEGILAGKPDYDSMSSGLAGATRNQLPAMQADYGKLGALQSVVFKGVGPAGPDIYSVRFEKGALEYRIWLGVNGKVLSANSRPEEGAVAVPVGKLTPHFAEIDALAAAEFGRRNVGSLTVGVVSGKDLAWTKSYGDADMEKKTAAGADTVYRIGSITKMFTALMLEQLVEAKKVRLSDPVEKYFPEIQQVRDRIPDAPPITLIQLATHTSGLDREPSDTETYVTGPVATWEKTLIAALPHTRYTLEPGTRYSYSNIGYAILGAALSRAAGESYLDYVPKHIFQPLGMTHTALEINPAIAAHLAKGYQPTGPNSVDSEIAQREHQTGRGYKVPNGAIYTTVGDLARFASFLMGQGPETVLKLGSLEQFQMNSIVPADLNLTHGYGIGFETHRADSYIAFGHGGSVAGYTADLLMNRKAGIAVISLSSGAANPSVVGQKSLDLLSK
jgi:CubicO group peptidase (beta-lactamase class C family)